MDSNAAKTGFVRRSGLQPMNHASVQPSASRTARAAATSRAIRAPGVSPDTEAAAGVRAGAARSVETAIGATFGAGGSLTVFFFSTPGTPGPVPADTGAGS